MLKASCLSRCPGCAISRAVDHSRGALPMWSHTVVVRRRQSSRPLRSQDWPVGRWREDERRCVLRSDGKGRVAPLRRRPIEDPMKIRFRRPRPASTGSQSAAAKKAQELPPSAANFPRAGSAICDRRLFRALRPADREVRQRRSDWEFRRGKVFAQLSRPCRAGRRHSHRTR